MQVELQSTCAALGYHEGDEYHKEPDCLETVKDLIRFLKHEDDTCEIRRQLGSAQIVQNDLVPLVKYYSDDNTLLDVVIRLLVNLTQPAVLCFQNHIPEDKTNRNYFLEIESHLQSYKEVFVDEAFFAIITKKLGDLLKLDWEHRQEEDRLLIERILVLIRNILHVPPNPAKEKRTDDDASVHDQVLWSLHISGVEDLLLYLASSEDETQFCLHVLEIISLMFREQTAEQLASSGVSRSASEKEQDERELELMRERERAQKRANMLKYSTRHSCFGGTYTVNNMKSISDRDVIFHRRLGNIKDITFDHNKPKKKKPKNRAPITTVELTRRSTLSIRVFLREFCVQLLENCYNPLMYAVKDILVRSKAQENDETYYLWAMRFFMEFNRRYNFRIDLVSETMSVQAFHTIHMNLQTFHEMVLTNKKEGVIWSRRLHLALNAYHELLETMSAMEKMKDPRLRDSANVMKSNVFYMLEYRDIFLMLLKNFDETKQSRTYLKDLVEATHLFVKMLESYSKCRSHLVVQRKKRNAGHRKKKQKASRHTNGTTQPSEEELEELWDNVSSELSAIFQGRGEIPQEVTPFDAASEIDVDLQRVNAMWQIQDGLRANRPGEAVALLRAAREVWPEREEFGSADISPEEEFMALREICYANIPRPENEAAENVTEIPEEEFGEDVEDELEESGVKVSEEEFNFNDFILRFVSPRVVQAYVTLLSQYKTNSAHTNHCVLKMLHRVGFECEMIGMLFQARLFRIFQNVQADPACTTRHFKELLRFTQHVVAQFIEVAQKNSKVFMELFFWKTVRDVRDITEGYGYTVHQSKKVKQLWSEEEDMELQQLVEQFRDEEPRDGDMADYVLANLIDQSKTRRQVVRQLVHLGLLGSAKDLKRRNGPIRSREWQEEEEEDLRQLLEEFKDNDYPLMDILSNLKVKRSRPKVIEKLLQLGLIQDKKEVMKKRKSKKGKKGKRDFEEDLEGFDEGLPPPSDNEENVDEEPEMTVTSSDESVGDQSDVDDDEPIYITKIRKSAKQALNSGLQASVQWISDTLSRTADEREEDGDEEPIPLVPVTEEAEEAMENPTFQSLLKRLGVKPPASEQEMFWRIAGKLSPNDLRSRVHALKTCLSTDNPDTRKTGGHLEALRALAKQKQADGGKRRQHRRSQTENTSSEDQVMGAVDQTELVGSGSNQSSPTMGHRAGKSRLKRSLPEFSEDESDNERLVIDTDEPAEATLQPAKRAKIVESDDSSDTDDKAGDTVNTQPHKRIMVVESDDSGAESSPVNGKTDVGATLPHTGLGSFPATMLSQTPDESDSDIDDHVPLRKVTKKCTIESDSDDD